MFTPISAISKPVALGAASSATTLEQPQASWEWRDIPNATPEQQKRALAMCLLMVIGAAALMPFAHLPWKNIPGFYPAYQTAAIISCLITAYLMYGHFKAARAKALLHLSAGYVYTAGALIMQLLSYKGALIENERVLGGPQTSVWLWLFWHLGLALSVLYIGLSEFRDRGARSALGDKAVRNSVAVLLLSTVTTALLVFVFDDRLAVLEVNGDLSPLKTSGIALSLQLLLAAALVVLWWASRFRNVLHVWLGILLITLLCDNAVTMMEGSRFTLGWYAGRMGALIGLWVMTGVYLQGIKHSYMQTVALTDQLVSANSQLDQDVKEKRMYAEKLLQADERKDELLVVLAHELRNPLGVMSAYSELLSRASTDEKLVRKTMEVLARQVKQMTGLVDDLLDVSRATRGLVVLDEVRLEAGEILAHALEQVQPVVKTMGHQLEILLPHEPAYILGDHDRMVQVMSNLLNNAVKYTPPGGKIVLRLEARATEVVFSVADNGIGMTPDVVEKAFTLFGQAELTPDRSHGGLGIGLALVKSLVEQHRGQVHATSQGLGCGSQFWVVLPRVTPT